MWRLNTSKTMYFFTLQWNERFMTQFSLPFNKFSLAPSLSLSLSPSLSLPLPPSLSLYIYIYIYTYIYMYIYIYHGLFLSYVFSLQSWKTSDALFGVRQNGGISTNSMPFSPRTLLTYCIMQIEGLSGTKLSISTDKWGKRRLKRMKVGVTV